MNISQEALLAFRCKYPEGIEDISSLNIKQKAWVTNNIKRISQGVKYNSLINKLNHIYSKIAHATTDIPDGELQEMASFIHENINDISKIIGVCKK